MFLFSWHPWLSSFSQATSSLSANTVVPIFKNLLTQFCFFSPSLCAALDQAAVPCPAQSRSGLHLVSLLCFLPLPLCPPPRSRDVPWQFKLHHTYDPQISSVSAFHLEWKPVSFSWPVRWFCPLPFLLIPQPHIHGSSLCSSAHSRTSQQLPGTRLSPHRMPSPPGWLAPLPRQVFVPVSLSPPSGLSWPPSFKSQQSTPGPGFIFLQIIITIWKTIYSSYLFVIISQTPWRQESDLFTPSS